MPQILKYADAAEKQRAYNDRKRAREREAERIERERVQAEEDEKRRLKNKAHGFVFGLLHVFLADNASFVNNPDLIECDADLRRIMQDHEAQSQGRGRRW